jgi:hypothetical protein
MTRPSSYKLPRRSAASGSEIRPGIALAAVAFVAIAIALVVLRAGDDPNRPPETMPSAASAVPRARDAAPLARRTPMPDRDALAALVPRARSVERPSPPRARRAPSIQPAVAEPQWDGTGQPSREWLRWQLSLLVEQGNEHGSVSGNALEAAVDDALALRTAKLEMERAQDPETLVAAQERVERARDSLVVGLGLEGFDFSAF